jgi:hypothetical protein
MAARFGQMRLADIEVKLHFIMNRTFLFQLTHEFSTHEDKYFAS